MARAAIHPGEQLGEELKALGMSAAELARQIEVPTNRTTEILNGELDRRHRIALGAFLWHQPGILAEPRKPL